MIDTSSLIFLSGLQIVIISAISYFKPEFFYPDSVKLITMCCYLGNINLIGISIICSRETPLLRITGIVAILEGLFFTIITSALIILFIVNYFF